MNYININTNDLSNALQDIIGVVTGGKHLPILSHVLIESFKGTVSLTATDAEVQVTRKVKADETPSDFRTTVEARKLYDIVKNIYNENIKISIEGDQEHGNPDNNFIIQTSRGKYKLRSHHPNEFPLFDSADKEETLTANQDDLKKLFNKSSFAIAHTTRQEDAPQAWMTGLIIEASPNKLMVLSTDGHRFVKSLTNIDKANIVERSVILPRKAVLEIQRVIQNEGKVKLLFTDTYITFAFNEITLTSKLIDKSIPSAVYGVIPDETEINILIKTENIKPALQRVQTITEKGPMGFVRINIDDNKLTIESYNKDQERAIEALDIDSTGESISMGFNITYLLDVITASNGELINIGLKTRPKKFEPTDFVVKNKEGGHDVVDANNNAVESFDSENDSKMLALAYANKNIDMLSKDSNVRAIDKMLLTDPSDPDTKYLVMPLKNY